MSEVLFETPAGRDLLRVVKDDFKGKTYIGVRLFYADAAGEVKPTAKGVNIAEDKPEVLIAVAAALLKAAGVETKYASDDLDTLFETAKSASAESKKVVYRVFAVPAFRNEKGKWKKQ